MDSVDGHIDIKRNDENAELLLTNGAANVVASMQNELSDTSFPYEATRLRRNGEYNPDLIVSRRPSAYLVPYQSEQQPTNSSLLFEYDK